MLNAEPPERFSQDYFGKLGFKSNNDRLWIGVLKDLGFLDLDGKPTQRYYAFLDRTQWKKILAQGIRDAFSELFMFNIKAHTMSRDEVKNKLRTLYLGEKTDHTIELIASTFDALVKEADFSETSEELADQATKHQDKPIEEVATASKNQRDIQFGSLQYQINIILPSTRDQSVYDAIFKSLREHLG